MNAQITHVSFLFRVLPYHDICGLHIRRLPSLKKFIGFSRELSNLALWSIAVWIRLWLQSLHSCVDEE